jgi:hypothetical protein
MKKEDYKTISQCSPLKNKMYVPMYPTGMYIFVHQKHDKNIYSSIFVLFFNSPE